jgi:hypothetical protein
MTETVSHVLFDRASTNAKSIEAKHSPVNAIDLTRDEAFYAKSVNDNEGIELTCHCHNHVSEGIDVLEIAFVKGKLRKTKFSVDYIDKDDKKHHVGTYESSGLTSDFQKFFFPSKVKDLKGVVIGFKGNNDKNPWFMIKGIRLAKFIEKTL